MEDDMPDQQQCSNCVELWKLIDRLEVENKKLEKEKTIFFSVNISMFYIICAQLLTNLIT